MRASFFVDRCAYKGHILDEATKVAHNAQLRRQRSVRRTCVGMAAMVAQSKRVQLNVFVFLLVQHTMAIDYGGTAARLLLFDD